MLKIAFTIIEIVIVFWYLAGISCETRAPFPVLLIGQLLFWSYISRFIGWILGGMFHGIAALF